MPLNPGEPTTDRFDFVNRSWNFPIQLEIRRGNHQDAASNPVISRPWIAPQGIHSEFSDGESLFWKIVAPPGNGDPDFCEQPCYGLGHTYRVEI